MPNKYKGLIDSVTRASGYGAISRSTANTFTGINHRGVGNPVKMNTDNHGLTFFTRPCLNLSYDNIMQNRLLHSMVEGTGVEGKENLARVCRTLLDPWGSAGVGGDAWKDKNTSKNSEGGIVYGGTRNRGEGSSLVDPLSPFISVLSNNLISISGWPDPNTDTWTSSEGWAKEQMVLVDDFVKFYGNFSLTANFRNIEGDPINYLFQTWRQYMTSVQSGDMTPYPQAIAERWVDYQTRIYRIVLDPTRRFVQKIAACGNAVPTANTLGASFNFSADAPMDQANAQVSIPFSCVGAEYNDPITIREFNALVEMFNSSMAGSDGERRQTMVKLDPIELLEFNNEGYPRISENMELEWWIFKDRYRQIKSEIYGDKGITEGLESKLRG